MKKIKFNFFIILYVRRIYLHKVSFVYLNEKFFFFSLKHCDTSLYVLSLQSAFIHPCGMLRCLFYHSILCDSIRFNELMYHNLAKLIWINGYGKTSVIIRAASASQQVNWFGYHVYVRDQEKMLSFSNDESITSGPIRTHSIH